MDITPNPKQTDLRHISMRFSSAWDRRRRIGFAR
jgi:hypothetical protein